MSATKRYKGTVLSLTFSQTAPSTATAVTITGAKAFKYDSGISVKAEAADGDIYPSVCFNDFNDPTLSFETIDAYAFASISPSVRGTLAFTVADAFNGTTASGGGKSYSVTNAYIASANIDHTFREFGKESATFKVIATDGTTSPLTVSAL